MENKIMFIYGTGGVAAPLKKCCEVFGKQNDIEFKFTFGKGSYLMEKINETQRGDLISFGAETYADKLEDEKIIDGNHRYFIGTREPVLLIPKGNPKKIEGFKDLVEREDIRIGVAYDGCLIGIWESILLNYNPAIVDKFRDKISSLADGCSAVVRDLFQEKNDVIIGWNTFAKFKEKDIDTVDLDEDIKVRRATNISLINFSKNREKTLELIKFIKSEEGIKIYNEYGWRTY